MNPRVSLCALCLVTLLAAAAAGPLRLDPATLARRRENAARATILEQESTKNRNGGYTLSFRTDNGIVQEETGTSYPGLLPGSGTYVKEGTVQYELDDGQQVVLYYVADENGFEILNPEALQQVLPTPPPTQYPVPKVPGAGMPVPEPLPEFNVGLFEIGATVSPTDYYK